MESEKFVLPEEEGSLENADISYSKTFSVFIVVLVVISIFVIVSVH